jgi:hypothetical protein
VLLCTMCPRRSRSAGPANVLEQLAPHTPLKSAPLLHPVSRRPPDPHREPASKPARRRSLDSNCDRLLALNSDQPSTRAAGPRLTRRLGARGVGRAAREEATVHRAGPNPRCRPWPNCSRRRSDRTSGELRPLPRMPTLAPSSTRPSTVSAPVRTMNPRAAHRQRDHRQARGDDH